MYFDRDKFTRNVKFLMELKGFSSETELATHANMSQPTITRILNSDSEPKLSNIMRIAEALNVDYWRLINDDLTQPEQVSDQPATYSATNPNKLTPAQIELLREVIVQSEKICLEEGLRLNASQRAKMIAAGFAAYNAENITASDIAGSRQALLASLYTAMQSSNV